jgi:hypothetical protein
VSSDVALAVRKLERQARLPQAIFLDFLKRYRQLAPAVLEEAFPIGFRTRTAPSFLADVYASGKAGRDWAKEWLKERSLLENAQARELVPTMSAIDSLMLEDELPDFINHIGTEKLAKRALGIVTAFTQIRREADWKRPSGGAKDWVSKVDWISARRIDPNLADTDLAFQNRALEEEVRKEMDREVRLLKVRNKLEERSKGAVGSSES